MLDPRQSRVRQKRLLEHLQALYLDAVVVANPQHVYYLSAFWTSWLQQSAFVLFSDGRSWLLTANGPAENVAADEVDCYQAQWHATQRQEQPAVVAEKVASVLTAHRATRVGIDASAVGSELALRSGAIRETIDPVLWQLRRVKDADELALMHKAIDCTRAMYERARQIIEPGVSELQVFNELHAAAVQTAGEPLSTLLGNDYQCASMGGPARKGRIAKAGELYILDLGPCYRGYFADNARTFAVNRKPTDQQHKAWEHVVEVHEIVRKMAKPGVRCREIWNAVNEHLRAVGVSSGMAHHLGHGVGLQPHEFPHLNPKWDDTLMEGEVFTAEPGIYSNALAVGIRIENQYLVTRDGVEDLVNVPMELC